MSPPLVQLHRHLDEECLVVQLLPQRLDLSPQRCGLSRPILVHTHLRGCHCQTVQQT
jgi:hypothetical protein